MVRHPPCYLLTERYANFTHLADWEHRMWVPSKPHTEIPLDAILDYLLLISLITLTYRKGNAGEVVDSQHTKEKGFEKIWPAEQQFEVPRMKYQWK